MAEINYVNGYEIADKQARQNLSDVTATANEAKNKTDVHEGQIEALQNEVSGLVSSPPIPVSSVSEMSDTTKIYVNTTDNNWYYYDGDSWEIGGQYLTSSFSAQNLKPLFKKITPQNIYFEPGGYNTSTGSGTATVSRFKNPQYMRSQCLIQNNNVGYKLLILYYRQAPDTYYYYYENSYITIEDNNIHYLNPNYALMRVVVIKNDGTEIPSSDYKTLWGNIDFYYFDDKKIIPETLVRGEIGGVTVAAQTGNWYHPSSEWNFSHYILPPYHFDKDTIVKIKYKNDLISTGSLGYKIFVFNEDKYVIGWLTNLHEDLDILVKKDYCFCLCVYGVSNIRVNPFELDNFLEITTENYSEKNTNYYKIPVMKQRKAYYSELDSALSGQGISNDEDYIYTTGNKGDDNVTVSKIKKSDLTVTKVENLPYHHGNSCCYNANNNTLVVGGTNQYIWVLDADTFELLNTIDITEKINDVETVSSVSYNPDFNLYCVCHRSTLYSSNSRFVYSLLDSNFDFVERIDITNLKYSISSSGVTGGNYLHNNMIGTIFYGGGNNLVYFNWEGKIISCVETGLSTEIEGYTIDSDGNYYVMFNRSDGYRIYKYVPSAYRLYTNNKIANNFYNIADEIYNDIVVANNTYIYDDVDKVPQTNGPSTWLLGA